MNQYLLKNGLSGKRPSRIKVAFVSLALTASTVCYAPHSSAALFNELSINELSEIRGKFLTSTNELLYFGLSMVTTWGTPSGTQSSGVLLSFDLSSTTPSVTVSQTGSLGEEIDNAPIIEPDTALQQISGGVQSIQVGGNGNTLENQLELNVDGSADTAQIVSSVDLATGVRTYKSGDGVITQFTNTGNSIGYAIQTDAGTVIQQLGGNPLDNHQLLQSINIRGNMQSILNTIGLDVRLNNNQQLKQTALGFTDSTMLFGLR
ncbi:MAG: hypothetical protein KBT63_08470 [Porticoccaceae bacterium]|nr:hypothetical protein [Porticoccaceae bacterium]